MGSAISIGSPQFSSLEYREDQNSLLTSSISTTTTISSTFSNSSSESHTSCFSTSPKNNIHSNFKSNNCRSPLSLNLSHVVRDSMSEATPPLNSHRVVLAPISNPIPQHTKRTLSKINRKESNIGLKKVSHSLSQEDFGIQIGFKTRRNDDSLQPDNSKVRPPRIQMPVPIYEIPQLVIQEPISPSHQNIAQTMNIKLPALNNHSCCLNPLRSSKWNRFLSPE